MRVWCNKHYRTEELTGDGPERLVYALMLVAGEWCPMRVLEQFGKDDYVEHCINKREERRSVEPFQR